MTAPDPFSILAVVAVTAALYKAIYWRADHPRRQRRTPGASPADH